MENRRHRDSEWALLPSLHLPESGEPKEHTQRQLWDQLAYMLGVLSLFDVWGWALISLHL